MSLKGLFRSLFEPSARSVIKQVRKHEEQWRQLSDADLRAKTDEFRARLADGEELFGLLPEAFACVVLAAERTVEMRHFDVQIQGGVELARGKIVEMKTGEGKTLVATLPAYLHALAGEGVHVVTVNDYLAARDAEWMGPIYRMLGLTVGVIQEVMANDRPTDVKLRKAAYACDITYVTNSEVVFDYLRDNLAYTPEEIVQRGFHYAIVDEVDLLLIDEAQTPLIISGPGHDDTELIRAADTVIGELELDQHYKVDRRVRSATLTDRGLNIVEKALGVGSLTDPANLPYAHATYQSLQAYGVYERDVEYIVENDEIHIVDEHTGRVSPEKRYSNGLHQALEAKERLTIRSEDLTLAKTSYQYYFRAYPGLCGMTGTAFTEKEELRKTYHLGVVRIPTHLPMVRDDFERIVFVTMQEKHDAVVEEIMSSRKQGRPVLVGTVSVDESEELSRRLSTLDVPHEVLNARQHEHEAHVVAQAGREGAVTISTNMAGRGTDIMLGGNPRYLAAQEADAGADEHVAALKRFRAECDEEHDRVVAAGGLVVIGTGEHESVRIDNQLRGRSGRQGDPGSSVYFVSLEDPVYQRFGQKKVLPALWEELAEYPEGEPVEAESVLLALEELRRKVETENEAIRLDVFKYDSVVHERRETIWGWRRTLLETLSREEWLESVRDLLDDLLGRLEEDVELELEEKIANGEKRLTAREKWAAILSRVLAWIPKEDLAEVKIAEREQAVDYLFGRYESRFGTPADEALIAWERQVLLDVIDMVWPQYLNDLERVEEAIWMRSYANRDPFIEFRKEAAVMYGQLMIDIESDAFRAWMSVEIAEEEAVEPIELPTGVVISREPVDSASGTGGANPPPQVRGIPGPGQRKKRRR